MPERTREIAELIVVGLGGAGLTGFWGWIQKRTSNKAENQTGEAAIVAAAAKMQEIMNEAARSHVAELRQEVASLKAEVATLRGELRDEQQRSNSLESILRRNGYDLSAASEPGAFTVIDPESQTASITPAPRRRKRP